MSDSSLKAEWEARHQPALGIFNGLRKAVSDRDFARAETLRQDLLRVLAASSNNATIKAHNRLVVKDAPELSPQFIINLEFLIFGGRLDPVSSGSEGPHP